MANDQELGFEPTPNAALAAAESQNDRAPEEAFDDLMTKMHTQRPIFFEIMRRCESPTAASEIDAVIDKMQKSNASVYTAATLCTILQQAGALVKVHDDGAPYVCEQSEPEIVTIDGVDYYKPSQPRKVYWMSTDLAKRKLAANKPAERLDALLADEQTYLAIYRRVLEMSARPEGATTEQFAKTIDDDPLMQKPRYYAPRFVNKLEQCEAIEWKGAWFITGIGTAALEHIATEQSVPMGAEESE